MTTWDEVGEAMMSCFRSGAPGHCFHSDILHRPDARLQPDPERRAKEGTIWFDRGDFIQIEGIRIPLTTEMVPCDVHRRLAQPLLD